ncbi:hypothetical protein [Microbulbifer sp. MCCC 1A16149]|uniref:hypothetical protein n=1 Tax=Microbulbifer sp. MCCC 1A16149 TaxID=3411322 RepID=UPI003D13D396
MDAKALEQAWIVVLPDGKQVKMVGHWCNHKEALEAAQWRWPGATVSTRAQEACKTKEELV